MYKDSNARLLAVVAIVIAILVGVVAYASHASAPAASHQAGGTTNYDTISGTGEQIGSGCGDSFTTCTGTKMSQHNFGSCPLAQNTPSSFVATTTQLFLCAATGVVAGDHVNVQLPAGAITLSTGQGFIVTTAVATTSGVIGVYVTNNTGAATSSFPQATTSPTLWESFH